MEHYEKARMCKLCNGFAERLHRHGIPDDTWWICTHCGSMWEDNSHRERNKFVMTKDGSMGGSL